jgi:hypothetical protein
MKQSISKKPAEASGSFELGGVLGQHKAFGLIAGRCSAAEAAAIRASGRNACTRLLAPVTECTRMAAEAMHQPAI